MASMSAIISQIEAGRDPTAFREMYETPDEDSRGGHGFDSHVGKTPEDLFERRDSVLHPTPGNRSETRQAFEATHFSRFTLDERGVANVVADVLTDDRRNVARWIDRGCPGTLLLGKNLEFDKPVGDCATVGDRPGVLHELSKVYVLLEPATKPDMEFGIRTFYPTPTIEEARECFESVRDYVVELEAKDPDAVTAEEKFVLEVDNALLNDVRNDVTIGARGDEIERNGVNVDEVTFTKEDDGRMTVRFNGREDGSARVVRFEPNGKPFVGYDEKRNPQGGIEYMRMSEPKDLKGRELEIKPIREGSMLLMMEKKVPTEMRGFETNGKLIGGAVFLRNSEGELERRLRFDGEGKVEKEEDESNDRVSKD